MMKEHYLMESRISEMKAAEKKSSGVLISKIL